jgi:hypothetical protein
MTNIEERGLTPPSLCGFFTHWRKEMKKFALFAFNGDFMCFIHVLLNALDMKERGHEVRIVIEGSATKLVPESGKEGNPMHALYQKAKGLSLIAGACKVE